MDLRYFWENVAIRGADDCWLWTRSTNNTGYGTLAIGDITAVAHRVAAWVCGMVPTIAAPVSHSDFGHVLHHCDVRRCCHPGHFFIGTYGDNARDAYAKGRRSAFVGEKHRNAKLTDSQVSEIRALYFNGDVRQVDLAKRYGVTQASISHYVLGKNYAHDRA